MGVQTLYKADGSELRRHLRYSPETGVFIWVAPITNAVKAGEVAGSVCRRGYRHIDALGEKHKAHRLAWLFVYGEWPSGDLDHINGRKDDNRIVNLRVATCSQNQANSARRVDNKSGFKGVSFHRHTGKWSATIQHQSKRKHLGLYATPEEASDAYWQAAQQLHGEFARAA